MKCSRPALVFLLSLLWGSEWIANDALGDLPVLWVLALRCFLATLFLLPWALSKPHKQKPSVGRNFVLGIGLIAAPALLLVWASGISPGLTVLLFAAAPLVATLFENRSGLAGAPYLIGGLLGVSFLVRGALSFSSAQGWSVMFVAIAVLSLSGVLVMARLWMEGQHMPSAIAIQMFTAGILLAVFSFLRDHSFPVLTLRNVSFVFVLAALDNVAAYLLLYLLLRRYRASQLSVLQWLIPVISVAETALWLHHLPAWDSVVGAVVAVLSAGLLLRLPTLGPPDTIDEIDPLTLKIT